MKIKNLCYLLTILFILAVGGANAQTTEFTYQGRLTDGGMSPNANYDFQFVLYSIPSGIQVPFGTRDRLNVPVTNGAFTVTLDFPAANFSAAGDRYLEIKVKPAGGGSYTTLSPRQKITSSPYSIRSLISTTADSATNATNADNANLLDGFETIQSFFPARRIYVSGTDGFLPTGTVNSATILDRTITADDLDSFAVTTSKIADTAVTTSKIADNTVTTPKIADDTVESSKLDSSMGLGIFSGSLAFVAPNGATEIVILNGRSRSDDSSAANSSLTPNRQCVARNFAAKSSSALNATATAQLRLRVNGTVTAFGCVINSQGQSCNSGTSSLSITPASEISLQINYTCSSSGGNCATNFLWGMECR